MVARVTDPLIRMSTCAALARCHRLSAITGILSALPWNECPRGTGFRNVAGAAP